MGKSSGSGQNQTVVSHSAPWGPEAPYLKEYLSLLNSLTTGQNAANTGGGTLNPNPLPQQQVAGLTPGELQGLNLEYGAVPGQQAVAGTAAGQATNILAGNNLNPASNPYLTAYYNAAAQPLTNQYQAATGPTQLSQAELAGAFGGSADAENRALGQYDFGNQLQNLAANIYEPAYQQGQQQITQTLGLSPSISAGLNVPGETALGAGGLQQQQQQQELNTQYGNAYQNAMWPYQQLGYLGSGLTGVMPAGGGTATTGYGMNNTGGNAGKGIGLGALGLGGLSSVFPNALPSLGSSLSSLGPLLAGIL